MKRFFTVLSVMLVVIGLIALAGGGGGIALGLLAIGIVGVGVAAYNRGSGSIQVTESRHRWADQLRRRRSASQQRIGSVFRPERQG